jgi:hypothetical protein
MSAGEVFEINLRLICGAGDIFSTEAAGQPNRS